jgi:hypothetical protein
MAKRKDRKGKKKARKGAKRGLPSAVQGLLQYLGGSGANLQPSAAPIRPRATGADAGETLTRYLAAKTQNLEAMRAAALGTSSAAQIEERALAKRAAEDVDKKVRMLSAGLKESDKEKKRVIKELEEQKAVLQSMGTDRLFETMRGQFNEIYVRQKPRTQYSGDTPFSVGMASIDPDELYSYSGRAQSEDYGMQSDVGTVSEDFEGGSFGGSRAPVAFGGGATVGEVVSGGGAAAELYMRNRPLERPIIRDPVPRTPRVRRAAAGGGSGAEAPQNTPKAKRAQISAGELRSAIKAATGVSASKIKLPSSRARYANVQAALGRTAGSSADIIAALKEAGVNLAET